MDKAPDAFRTISEVAEEISVPQHVLRFWESRFTQIKPLKRGGGRRYYRPDDVDLLRGVRHLLYGEGYTIRGVQRILREEGLSFVQDVWRAAAAAAPGQHDDRTGVDEHTPQPHEPSFFDGQARADAGVTKLAAERREPLLTPSVTAEPAPIQSGLGSEDRGRLRTALDELVACRLLIEAALAGDAHQDHGGEAG